MDLELRDFFSFKPKAGRMGSSSSVESIRLQAQKYALQVTLEASHAAKVTLNSTLYLPRSFEDSIAAWTFPQQKPVQIHHDIEADPIGRVIKASYIPYNSPSPIQNQDIESCVKLFRDAQSLDQIFDAVQVLEETGILADANWTGLGELELVTRITDSLAVEKFLDGRYMGVSTSSRPVHAYCSICKKDWKKDGFCQHERGLIDEESGRRQFIIIDGLIPMEVSPVNHPADNRAGPKLISLISDSQGKTTFYYQKNETLDQILPSRVNFELTDSDGRIFMPTQIDQNTQETHSEETSQEEAPPVNEKTQDQKIEEALKTLFEDKENFTRELAELINETLELEVEEDTKLPIEKRKSLAPSIFCGPEKSFPVPDCAHVIAAKRLIGRYKGPGDNTKILACVSRKAKSLGCPGSEEEDQNTETQVEQTLDQKKDEELLALFSDVEKILISRNLKIDHTCKECEIKNSCISTLEEKNDSLDETIKVLRDEYRTLSSEYVILQDQITRDLVRSREAIQELIELKKILVHQDAEEDLSSLTYEDLQTKSSSFDLQDSLNLFQSGVSQNIQDVQITPEDSETKTPEIPPEENFALGVNIELAKNIVNSISRSGEPFAKQWLKDYQRSEVIPENISLDSLQQIVQQFSSNQGRGQ